MDYNTLLKQFPGYQGWGQSEALADFKATGGSGKGGAQANPSQNVQQNQQQNYQQIGSQYQQQIAPAVQTYQQEIPQTKSAYDAAISAITGGSQTAVNQATRAEDAQLAARGISPLAADYKTQQAAALQPVTSQYAGMAANTGLQANQQTNAIQNMIAALQGGNALGIIQASQGLTGQQQNAPLIAAQAAQAQTGANYVPTPYGVFDISKGQFIQNSGLGALSGGQTSLSPAAGQTATFGGVGYTYQP